MNSPKKDRLRLDPRLVEERHAYFAEHLDGGRFFNPWGDRTRPSPLDMLKWQLSQNPYKAAKRAAGPLQPIDHPLEQYSAAAGANLRMMWLGHASFFIELDGFRCLIDPVYGTVGWVVQRSSPEPIPLSELPSVDAVFLTHGHYDHLDTPTLETVARQNDDVVFVVPLGLDDYLPDACRNVEVLDWWETIRFGEVEACLVPSQHWHRRGLLDYNRALWGGWVLRGSRTVHHAGDTGYDRGLFETLGTVFDPIDFTLLPVGAYEPKWFMAPQHVSPAEAVKAFQDLGAEHFVAMHWGTYDLTDEPLKMGAERLRMLVEAGDFDPDRFSILRPGETISD